MEPLPPPVVVPDPVIAPPKDKGEAKPTGPGESKPGAPPKAAPANGARSDAKGVCKFFAAGDCKFGAKCKNVHALDVTVKQPESTALEPSQAWRVDPKSGNMTVNLDVRLSDVQLELMAGDFPEVTVVNGLKASHPHALSRAQRTVVAAILLARVDCRPTIDMEPTVLEIQGAMRGDEIVPLNRHVCRCLATRADMGPDVHMCPTTGPTGECSHIMALRHGHYRTIMGLDVPVSPAEVAVLMERYPHIVNWFFAVHLYQGVSGKVGDQSYLWLPPQEYDPDDISRTGSVGRYLIQCQGHEPIMEPDQYFLHTGTTFSGVRAEIVAKYGGYVIFRYVRAPPTPVIDMAVGNVCRSRGSCPPLRVAGMPVYVVNPDCTIFVVGDKVAHVDLSELNVEWQQVAGREFTPAVQASVARRLARAKGSTAAAHMQLVLAELKLREEGPLLSTMYQPASTRRWFNWCRGSRASDIRAQNEMRVWEGDHRPTPWGLVYAVCAALLACLGSVPWPNLETYTISVPTPWFTWTEFARFGARIFHLPGLRLFNVEREAWRWTLEYGHWQLPGRFIMWVLVFTLFIRSAHGQPLYNTPDELVLHSVVAVVSFLAAFWLVYHLVRRVTLPRRDAVRESYLNDRFAPIAYTGPLADRYGLPGYITQVAPGKVAEGCFVKKRGVELVTDPERNYVFALGVVFGDCVPNVARPCQENMYVALCNRQCAPVPLPASMDEFRMCVNQFFFAWTCHEFAQPEEPNYKRWNARFPVSRQKQHDAAAARMAGGAPPSLRSITRRKAFSKIEKILKRSDYAPRAICGGTDEWNVLFGPFYLSTIEAIKPAFRGSTLYAIGCTSEELGCWFDDSVDGSRAICGDDQVILCEDPELGRVALIGDGAKHDSHMHEGFWELKWRSTLWVWGEWNFPPRMTAVVAADQADTYGEATFGIRFAHPFRVRSGDPDTSGGNTVCTDFVAWWLDREFRVFRAQGATLGECSDMIAAKARRVLGYSIELRITTDMSDVDFLSGAFYPVRGKTYWGPLPGRQLAKIGWTTSRPTDEFGYRQLAGTLNSFRAYMFIPFFRVYLRHVMSLVPPQFRHCLPGKLNYQAVLPGETPDSPGPDTWEFFALRYGLTERDEVAFQVVLAQATTLPFMVESEQLSIMVLRDIE